MPPHQKTVRGGGVSKGKKAKQIVKHVTNNITYNINNYFQPQQGPAPAPEAVPEKPPNLFPENEVSVRAPYHHGGTYRRIQSNRSGKLIGDCGNCTSTGRDIADFGPDECNKNGRKRPAFFEAIAAYTEAYAARDYDTASEARATLEEMRTVYCPPCRKTANTLTGEKKKCYDFWQWFKEEACAGPDGGCANQDCVERGPLAVYVIEADHKNPEEKVHHLSQYSWWARNGGVAAMRLEAEKVRMLCRFCHRLEKTGLAARRSGDPDLMPDGKRSGTEEEVKQYEAKRKAKNTYPKQEYVDTEKLRRAHCLQCERPVTNDTAFAFDFDHRDPETKMIGEDTLAGVQGGVSGLVGNHANAASLAKIKGVLDAEMAKCDLLCSNCHKRKTEGYPMRG
jgi:5-methylcytosine-specific restriction endonuclease McrA